MKTVQKYLHTHLIQASTIIELLVASMIVYICYILFLMVFVKLAKPQLGVSKFRYYYESTRIIDSLKRNNSFVPMIIMPDGKELYLDIAPSKEYGDMLLIHGYILSEKDTLSSVYSTHFAQ